MSDKVLSKPTQLKDILDYFQVNEWLSAHDANDHLGIESFSRRICDLREKGYDFFTRPVTGIDRRGKKFSGKEFKIKSYPAKADENGQYQIKV